MSASCPKRGAEAEREQADLALSLDTKREKIGTRYRYDNLLRRRKTAATAEAKAALAHHKIAVASGEIIYVEEFEKQCAK